MQHRTDAEPISAPSDAPPRGAGLRIGLATVAEGWEEDDDAPALVDALERQGAWAGPASWDDPGVDWSSFDLVVVRSTWDYAQRPEAFVAWARRVAEVTTLLNPPEVLAWNVDKHHLAALAARGCPVVPTTFVEPGEDPAAIRDLPPGELFVKPAVSAGSKDTARHQADRREDAVEHARALVAAGRTAMVQPYLASVDRVGETGMVHLDGELSHAFRKGPLLTPGGQPVEGLFAREEIEPRTPADDEVALAEQVLAAACAELGVDRLAYARVDVLRDDGDRPVLLELELTEPSFFLDTDPGAADRAARCFAEHARRARAAREGR